MKLIYTCHSYCKKKKERNAEKSKFDRESYSMRNKREPAFMNLPSYTWPLCIYVISHRTENFPMCFLHF